MITPGSSGAVMAARCWGENGIPRASTRSWGVRSRATPGTGARVRTLIGAPSLGSQLGSVR